MGKGWALGTATWEAHSPSQHLGWALALCTPGSSRWQSGTAVLATVTGDVDRAVLHCLPRHSRQDSGQSC